MQYKVKLWTFSCFNDDAGEALVDGFGGSAELTYECELPFPPFPGLMIKGLDAEIEKVSYDVKKKLFECEAKLEHKFNDTFDIICTLEPELKEESNTVIFNAVMGFYLNQGWQVEVQSVPVATDKK
ncbi:MAG: hypothetical protein WCP55_07375 [Lentisphaerota bacterium]